MTTLDIITIVLFSLGVVLVGLAFSQKGKSMQSFFAANGTMPWYMSGLSLFMGFFSAGTFVVWGSIAYSMGWVSITIQWTMAIAGFIVGLLIAPKWHKTGALTAAEYIHKRLGKSTEDIYLPVLIYLCVSYSIFPVSSSQNIRGFHRAAFKYLHFIIRRVMHFVCVCRRIMGSNFHRRTSIRYSDSSGYHRGSFIFR